MKGNGGKAKFSPRPILIEPAPVFGILFPVLEPIQNMKSPMRILLNVVLVAAVVGAIYEWQIISRLRMENGQLQAGARAAEEAAEAKSSGTINSLQTEIKRLTAETAEIHKLRNEIGLLRKGSNELARLRSENLQLRESAKAAAASAVPANSPGPAGDGYFPKENWAFAGYATPEAAFQSAVWAMKEGDYKTFMASLGPEMRANFEKEFANKTSEEFSAEGKRKMEKTAGFRILDQTPLSENVVILNVFPDGEPHAQKMILRKLGAEWKLDGPYRENN